MVRIYTNANLFILWSKISYLIWNWEIKYTIGKVLTQQTLDNLGQWHLIAYYLHKIIPIKTWYKTHDKKLLAIVKLLQTWQHYLKGCKHKVIVLTNNNNFYHFMNTKNLSFRQVRWAQKLCTYHFQINYC